MMDIELTCRGILLFRRDSKPTTELLQEDRQGLRRPEEQHRIDLRNVHTFVIDVDNKLIDSMPALLNCSAMKCACSFDTQKPSPLTASMSVTYLSKMLAPSNPFRGGGQSKQDLGLKVVQEALIGWRGSVVKLIDNYEIIVIRIQLLVELLRIHRLHADEQIV